MPAVREPGLAGLVRVRQHRGVDVGRHLVALARGARIKPVLDPAQIQALRKIATGKSIPYQTLIRQWLADGIRRELRLTLR